MIKFIDDAGLIIPLWQEAFGDCAEDIEFFLKNCKHKACLALVEGEELVSMLFLVDCKCCESDSKYIYAACTCKAYRSKGAMSALLEFCKKNYGSVCLIPADEDLVKYYKKRGFAYEHMPQELSFDESGEIKEYLFEGCELKRPMALEMKNEF